QSVETENYMACAEKIYECGQLIPEEDENNH
ncbi:unnamed protein product, partial [Rotaria sp. Silwood1]